MRWVAIITRLKVYRVYSLESWGHADTRMYERIWCFRLGQRSSEIDINEAAYAYEWNIETEEDVSDLIRYRIVKEAVNEYVGKHKCNVKDVDWGEYIRQAMEYMEEDAILEAFKNLSVDRPLAAFTEATYHANDRNMSVMRYDGVDHV